MIMSLLAVLLLSVFLTIALIPLCSRLALALDAVDRPDSRRVHSMPTPRSGGLAMALGMSLPILLWVPLDPFLKAFLASAAMILVFGLVDDIVDMDCRAKFGVQTAAALLVVLWGGLEVQRLGDLLPEGVLLPRWVGTVLAVLLIVGVTNAVNFTDGLDGLAGGISLLGFICIGFIAHKAGDRAVALLCLAVIGAVFGFLRFNTHPANLFMGDSGSQLLGFTAITLALRVSQTHPEISPLLPLLLLGFPILDLLAVSCERIVSGRSPFVADRNHLHHKIMRLGLEHDEAVWVIYVLQAFLVSAAFVMRFQSDWTIMFVYGGFSGAVLTGFYVAGRSGWRWERRRVPESPLVRRIGRVRESGFMARFSFRGFEGVLIGLLWMTWVIPDGVPRELALGAWGGAAFLGVVWLFRRDWLGAALRVTLYLSIPFAVYLSETDPSAQLPMVLLDVFDGAFAVLAVLLVMTLKFTRRNRGFRTTPMDFLTIFIALVVPNLPDVRIEQLNLGLLSAKIIVLFFACEVWMGELRGNYGSLFYSTLGILGIAGMRGCL